MNLTSMDVMELDAALRSYEATQSQDAKLDVIVNATVYTYLINRHIDKENLVVFSFGEREFKGRNPWNCRC